MLRLQKVPDCCTITETNQVQLYHDAGGKCTDGGATHLFGTGPPLWTYGRRAERTAGQVRLLCRPGNRAAALVKLIQCLGHTETYLTQQPHTQTHDAFGCSSAIRGFHFLR